MAFHTNMPLDSSTNEFKREKTSVLIKRITANLSVDEVRFGIIIYQLRTRSFGGVFIFLGGLSLFPGISIFSGLVMIVPAVQMAIGFRSPRFPRFLREYQIGARRLREIGEKGILWIERVELILKPRWLILTTSLAIPLLGCLIACLAIMILIPLPFSNFMPSVSILLLALGLLERDGLFIFLGLLLSTVAIALGCLGIYFSLELIGRLVATGV